MCRTCFPIRTDLVNGGAAGRVAALLVPVQAQCDHVHSAAEPCAHCIHLQEPNIYLLICEIGLLEVSVPFQDTKLCSDSLVPEPARVDILYPATVQCQMQSSRAAGVA